MKRLSRYICAMIVLLISFDAIAQKNTVSKVETTFKVEGVCGMCKERIEDAAYGKGVKFAEWDKKSSILTVVYVSRKTTELAIHERIADAGHATEKVPADDEAYDKLPACCSYHDGTEKH